MNIFHCVLSYEKMVSGQYLGEIVRLALVDLIDKEELFEGHPFTGLDKVNALDIKKLCIIEKGYVIVHV